MDVLFVRTVEQCYPYIVDMICTKCIKAKATKDMKKGLKNVYVINSENKGLTETPLTVTVKILPIVIYITN